MTPGNWDEPQGRAAKTPSPAQLHTKLPWSIFVQRDKSGIEIGPAYSKEESAVLAEDGCVHYICSMRAFSRVVTEQQLADARYIVTAANSLPALKVVADVCEKLRLAINPLLTELPEHDAKGRENWPLRLKTLELQVEAEKALEAARQALAQSGESKV